MPARANDALDQTRRLQIKLYLAAKRSPTRRFHALYDKVHRTDVLERAWAQVKANQGSPGVDAETIEAIETRGVVGFLAQLQEELRTGTYQPQAVRRVRIPKPQGASARWASRRCGTESCKRRSRSSSSRSSRRTFGTVRLAFDRTGRRTRRGTGFGKGSRASSVGGWWTRTSSGASMPHLDAPLKKPV